MSVSFQVVFTLTPSAMLAIAASSVQMVLMLHMRKHQENNCRIASLVPSVNIII